MNRIPRLYAIRQLLNYELDDKCSSGTQHGTSDPDSQALLYESSPDPEVNHTSTASEMNPNVQLLYLICASPCRGSFYGH